MNNVNKVDPLNAMLKFLLYNSFSNLKIDFFIKFCFFLINNLNNLDEYDFSF